MPIIYLFIQLIFWMIPISIGLAIIFISALVYFLAKTEKVKKVTSGTMIAGGVVIILTVICMGIYYFIPEIPEAIRKASQTSAQATVSYDEENDIMTINLSKSEFEKAGFSIGDSCKIEFNDGTWWAPVVYYTENSTEYGEMYFMVADDSGKMTIHCSDTQLYPKPDCSKISSATIELDIKDYMSKL